MDRKEFLRTSAILAGASILPSNSVFAENINNNGIDQFTDEEICQECPIKVLRSGKLLQH